MVPNDITTITATGFRRCVGKYQDMALVNIITESGREWTVLMSAAEYHRLKRRDRQVVVARDLTSR